MDDARTLARDEITRLFGPHGDDPLDLYELILEGQCGDYKGPLNGTIVFTTDATGNDAMSLRFSGIIR